MRLIVNSAASVEQFVKFWNTEVAIIVCTFTGDKLIDLTVRIRSARPAAHANLKVPRLLLAEQCGVLSRDKIDLKPSFLCHRLNDLTDLLGDRIVGNFQLDHHWQR
ncbi:hypothetical protein D3C81_1684510 [compost metagenome]